MHKTESVGQTAWRPSAPTGAMRPQGPEEMCLLLAHKNPSKTSEKMGYFDRVTVSSHILYTANQETEGSQDRSLFFSSSVWSFVLLGTSCLGRPSGDVLCASEAMACGY